MDTPPIHSDIPSDPLSQHPAINCLSFPYDAGVDARDPQDSGNKKTGSVGLAGFPAQHVPQPMSAASSVSSTITLVDTFDALADKLTAKLDNHEEKNSPTVPVKAHDIRSVGYDHGSAYTEEPADTLNVAFHCTLVILFWSFAMTIYTTFLQSLALVVFPSTDLGMPVSAALLFPNALGSVILCCFVLAPIVLNDLIDLDEETGLFVVLVLAVANFALPVSVTILPSLFAPLTIAQALEVFWKGILVNVVIYGGGAAALGLRPTIFGEESR